MGENTIMNGLTRREFFSRTSEYMSRGYLVGGCAFLAASKIQSANGSSLISKSTEPPHIYSLETMPRVDVHVHLENRQQAPPKDINEYTETFIKTMDQTGITVAINLSGDLEMVSTLADYDKRWQGRILVAPRDKDIRDGLWWSEEDLKRFHEAGCAGVKIWAQNRPGILEESLVRKVRSLGDIGLPAIGFHVADPPEGKWNTPDYAELIQNAEQMIRQTPNTTFIMAHGFWMMNNDVTLDLLATFFDRYPNLNVDLCAAYQWWDLPEPTHEKLRNFILRYKDRLLFGTDAKSQSTPEQFRNVYRILESTDENLPAFFVGEDTTTVRGLGLPLDVLNHIYYWNAARLIPRVKKSLLELGYTVG